ncbi:MAG: lysophospholipid acyltransferase family protein [bacterium]|nr:MAG: lysophospholipid acyltransferase family protein [bacterium]
MEPKRSRHSPFREWRRKQAYRVLPVFPPIGRIFIRLFGATLRSRFQGEGSVLEMVNSGQPFLLTFFHGRQFLLVHQLRGWPVAIMTSISYMGEIQSRILKGFGYRIIRGSSSRGGARVLGQMMRLVRRGAIGSFAVDGPRGPGGVVKPGVVFAARKLNIPVVPVSTSAWPSVVFRSTWDRYLLPLPFSRAVVLFGVPMHLGEDSEERSVQSDCLRIAEVLRELEKEADVLIGRVKG